MTGLVAPQPDRRVARACAWLEKHGATVLNAPGPFSAQPLASCTRAHSTIQTIELSSPTTHARFYLKILHDDPSERARKLAQLETEYRVLKDLCAMFANFSSLGVVQPVACFPDDLALITREFPGAPLSKILSTATRPVAAAATRSLARNLCRLAGSWLSHFQRLPHHHSAALYDLDEILLYCDHRLRLISSRDAGRLSSLSRITRRLEKLAASVEPADRRIVVRHNDFRPDNILATPDRLVVLDFTGFTYGPPLYDVLKFWTRVDLFGLARPWAQSRVHRLKLAFLEGYQDPVDPASPIVRLLLAANLIDLLSDLLESQEQGPYRRSLQKWAQARIQHQLHNVLT